MLDAQVPYHASALKRYLNSSQPHGCNSATARAMALQAFLDATTNMPEQSVFGLGCAAAIATNRDRKGTDRCHIAIQSRSRTRSIELTLDKSLSREVQETACREMIIGLMAEESGIDVTYAHDFESVEHNASEAWQNLIMDHADKTAPADEFAAILPGAFNPLHDGHRQILARASELLACKAALEISIRNVDKPTLDYLTMRERQDQAAPLPLVFTNAPTFEKKSAVFPGVTFIVGIDTVTRIQEARYYHSVAARDSAIKMMKERGNRFLVFGRKMNEEFQTLDDIDILPALKSLCTGVNEDGFRLDISSSELRQSKHG